MEWGIITTALGAHAAITAVKLARFSMGFVGCVEKNDAIKFAFEALVVYSEVNKREQQRSSQGQLAREALAKFKDVGIDKYYWS